MAESLRTQATATASNIGMLVLLVIMLLLFGLLVFSLRDKPDAFKSLSLSGHPISNTTPASVK